MICYVARFGLVNQIANQCRLEIALGLRVEGRLKAFCLLFFLPQQLWLK